MKYSVTCSWGDAEIYAPRAGELNATLVRSLLAHETRLGLDTEGVGFRKKHPNQFALAASGLRLIQFGTTYRAVVLDLRDIHQRNLALSILGEDRIFVAHNARHEIVSIHQALGLDISRKTYDTYLLSLLLQPGANVSGVHGLKPLTLRYIDSVLSDYAARLEAWFQENAPDGLERDDKEQVQERKSRWGWDTIPSDNPIYVQYAGLDAIYARRLAPLLVEQLQRREIYPVIAREQRLGQLAARMAIKGWRTNSDTIQGLLDDHGTRHLQSKRLFHQAYGFPTGSPHKVDWALGQGVSIEAVTQSGAPSLAGEEVRRLLPDYPSGDVHDFLTLLDTTASTQNVYQFLSSLCGFRDADGWVHPTINTLHAVTGRMSVRDPALQTVSWRNPARTCFTADQEDHVLVSADFSQIEPRIFAVFCGDRHIAEVVSEGKDLYGDLTKLIGNRKIAKRVLLGRGYMSGVATMTQQIRMKEGLAITEAQVRDAFAAVDLAHPRFRPFSLYLKDFPEIRLPSGRIVPTDPQRGYKNANSLVQGHGRDMLVDAIFALDDAGLGDTIRMPSHDEVILSLPKKDLTDTLTVVKKCMTVPFEWMPIETEIEVYTQGIWMKDMELWNG